MTNNVFGVNSNRERFDSDLGVEDVASRRDVVLEPVPGAGHDRALEVALPDRAAMVQAGVVERIEVAVYVVQRE